ncbi:hypothetical protein GCM10022200_05400 [Microbacterium awajiense]|uniref:Uncharacterized protein n=1 Tax=Microbacterium awajiense TaxID=415214 RepID=A0ABP7A6H9_9MICO
MAAPVWFNLPLAAWRIALRDARAPWVATRYAVAEVDVPTVGTVSVPIPASGELTPQMAHDAARFIAGYYSVTSRRQYVYRAALHALKPYTPGIWAPPALTT